jgi:uncharacterized protein (UPF0548 family)
LNERPRSIDSALRARLEEISQLDATIDLTRREQYLTETGWNIDAREIALLPEHAGPPEDNGSFTTAVSILRDYRFTPQRLISGHFDPDAPLEARPMLLSARFLWMRFELGVRVHRVIDEIRSGAFGEETVWGYSYHTLAGHLERGEITFEVAKHMRTGKVDFRIHSLSQTGHIANWFYRIGFRMVGRRLQRRFAVESLQNMQQMVHDHLSQRETV